MRALILCEGKTDAILISYLLCKVSGWKPAKADKKMSISVSEKIFLHHCFFIMEGDINGNL